MTYRPAVMVKKDRLVLEIIGCGHSDGREMTFRTRFTPGEITPGRVNALEWEEAQIASGLPDDEFGSCIAHLIGSQYIENGVRLPGLLRGLFGKEEINFFWITDRGRIFLADQSEADTPDFISLHSTYGPTGTDIDDAVVTYENSLEDNPYVKPDKIEWAIDVLDDDIKAEIKVGVTALHEMWSTYDDLFGLPRQLPSTVEELGVRDPVVKTSVVRIFRANDEQRQRKGFPPADKPRAWLGHFNGGDVGLSPAPWEL